MPTLPKPGVDLNVRLDPQLAMELYQLVMDRELTIRAAVREAIAEYVEKRTKEQK